MPTIEELPREIFRQVVSLLAYFDKKSLYSISRQCHASVRKIPCGDKISEFIYICRLPTLSSAGKELLFRPGRLEELLRETRASLTGSVKWSVDDTCVHLHSGQYVCP